MALKPPANYFTVTANQLKNFTVPHIGATLAKRVGYCQIPEVVRPSIGLAYACRNQLVTLLKSQLLHELLHRLTLKV